jgi:acyl-CoA thioester hydrolase
MMYFQEHGFSMREFERLRLGPVITRDDLEYFREMRLLESIVVTLALAGLSEDESRFRIRNEFWRDDRKAVARVTSTGGWLDLGTRKLSPPPEALARALNSLPRTDDFQVVARTPERTRP